LNFDFFVFGFALGCGFRPIYNTCGWSEYTLRNLRRGGRIRTWTTRGWFMYSYEDRIRAVELYIKLGKRVKPTIHQLAYPTKNALKDWYREYEQRLDLLVGYACRKPKYSQAQKEA